MRMQELGRFEAVGDTRVVSIGKDDDAIVLREDLCGPSVRFAFGAGEVSVRLRLGPEALSALLVEAGPFWEALATGELDVFDLMDVCDEAQIPYVYQAIGSSSGLQFRAVA